MIPVTLIALCITSTSLLARAQAPADDAAAAQASDTDLPGAAVESGSSATQAPAVSPARDPAVEHAAEEGAAVGEPAVDDADYERLVLEALEAYGASDWPRARRLFEQAHARRPTARTLRTIGMSAFNQGDMLGALQSLEASLTDRRRPLTASQRADVIELIRRVDMAVGRLMLELRPETATVEIDGKAPTRLADGHLALEPGRHELLVSAPGHRTRTQYVRIAAGDRATLELRLEREQEGAAAWHGGAPGADGDPRVAAGRVAERGSDGGDAWAWVALSIGAAGAVAGGVATGLGLSERSTLDDACPDRRCGPDQHDRLARYDVFRTIAITGGIIGVVGLGTGAVLLWTGDGEPERAPRVEAWIGPAFAGVRGQL